MKNPHDGELPNHTVGRVSSGISETRNKGDKKYLKKMNFPGYMTITETK